MEKQSVIELAMHHLELDGLQYLQYHFKVVSIYLTSHATHNCLPNYATGYQPIF